MKHPFQSILYDPSGEYLVVSVKQTLQIFNIAKNAVVKTWQDELDSSYILSKQQKQKIEALHKQGIFDRIPKIPQLGLNAPLINNFIRNLLVTDKYIVITTDTDKLCVIFAFDVTSPEVITMLKRVELPKRPCSIIVDLKQENVLLGDKFGDVYKISTDPLTVDNLVPILGHVSMLTTLNSFVKLGKEYLITTDRDEHIKISNYPELYVIELFLFEHLNFISTTLVTQDLKMLTGGGDDFICYWDLNNNQLLNKVDLKQFYPEVKEREFVVLKLSQFGEFFIIVLEQSSELIILNKEFQLVDKLDLNSFVLDICTTDKSITVSLENSTILFITHSDKFNITYDTEIINNSIVDCKDSTEFIPLFTIGNLRKYSEKYN